MNKVAADVDNLVKRTKSRPDELITTLFPHFKLLQIVDCTLRARRESHDLLDMDTKQKQ